MPELQSRDEFAVIGITVRTSNEAEMRSSDARIPALWNEYFAAGVTARIPNRTPDQSTFAVYTEYESDHTGPYSLVLGQQVSSLDQIPDKMVGLNIPAGRYLVFSADGPVPDAIVAAWREIWTYFQDNPHYKRAYSSDFEVYGTVPNTAEIFIALA
jgi:predicted transcriptional regulator YdeE